MIAESAYEPDNQTASRKDLVMNTKSLSMDLTGRIKSKISSLLDDMDQDPENALPAGRRKQIELARKFVDFMKDNGKKSFTAAQAEDFFKTLGWDKYWDRNSDAQDDLGLRRSLGDTFGNHGLKMAKYGRPTRYMVETA